MSPKEFNRATGKLGEAIGANYLKQRGYQIIERYVQSPFGQIDLIASHRGTLVFVEVKTRRDQAFGHPEEAVDERKKNQLARLASWYLAHHPKAHPAARFDVLSIQLSGDQPNIRLIENAFEL